MPNFRYILRLVSAFFSRFKALIVIGIALGVLFFFALKLLIPIMSGESITKVGLTGRFQVSSLPVPIQRNIGNGLTRLTPDGNVEPDLATSWETPDKGTTWIFKLDTKAVWQDGESVKSQDINYQFSDVTIERPDAATITFKLQNPYSAFPSIVARPVFKTGLLGTGEWRVQKLSLAGSYVDQLTLINRQGVKAVYKFYPTEERTKLAFKRGEVDEVRDIIDPAPLNSWPKVKIEASVNTGEYVAIFFNTQDKLLSDKNIRQSLAYAIDKEALGSMRALSPLPETSWAYNPQVKPYNYDKDRAKEIIDDAPSEIKDNLTINLTTSPILLSSAEKIVKDWEAIGIKVNLQVLSNIPSDYQAILAIFDTPDDPDQYSVWHSTQVSTNITKYQNARIDKLLEDGRSEIDLEARRKIYLDFQRYLVEDSPAIFLYYPTTYTIKRR